MIKDNKIVWVLEHPSFNIDQKMVEKALPWVCNKISKTGFCSISFQSEISKFMIMIHKYDVC